MIRALRLLLAFWFAPKSVKLTRWRALRRHCMARLPKVDRGAA